MSRTSVIENLAIFVMVVVTMCAIIFMDRTGAAQKWHAAVVGTGFSFGGVALVYQRKWPPWRFWGAWGICFVLHVLAVWIVFDRLLAGIQRMGILIWIPIAFLEGVFLLGLVPALELKLKGRKKKVKAGLRQNQNRDKIGTDKSGHPDKYESREDGVIRHASMTKPTNPPFVRRSLAASAR